MGALSALRAALVRMAAGIRMPQELANHLAFLQLELSDDDFHQQTLQYASEVIEEIRALLADAIDQGEQLSGDPTQSAHAL